MTLEQVLNIVHQMIQSAPYCLLTTVDAEGQPYTRLMDAFAPEEDLTIWMATNRITRKVDHLRANPRAAIAWHDVAGDGCVSIACEARLVDDLAERERRWKTRWEDFYPGGPADPDYLLIEFVPRWLELVSYAHNIATQPTGFKPAVLVREGAGWRIEHLPE